RAARAHRESCNFAVPGCAGLNLMTAFPASALVRPVKKTPLLDVPPRYSCSGYFPSITRPSYRFQKSPITHLRPGRSSTWGTLDSLPTGSRRQSNHLAATCGLGKQGRRRGLGADFLHSATKCEATGNASSYQLSPVSTPIAGETRAVVKACASSSFSVLISEFDEAIA